MFERNEVNRGERKVFPPPQPPAEEHDAESVDVGHQEDGMEPRPPEDAPEQETAGEDGVEAEAEAGQEAAADQPTETLEEKAIRLAREIQQDTPVPRRYWALGEAINNILAQNGKKGKSKIIKGIAEQSHLSEDSIRKAQRFHQKYMNRPIFERLFAAGPHVSWHMVSNNLSIEPKDFVKMCEKNKTAVALKNAVIEYRAPDKTKTNNDGEVNGEDSGPQDNQEGAAVPKPTKKDLEAKVTAFTEKVDKARRRVGVIIHTAKMEGASEGILRALDQLMDDLKL